MLQTNEKIIRLTTLSSTGNHQLVRSHKIPYKSPLPVKTDGGACFVEALICWIQFQTFISCIRIYPKIIVAILLCTLQALNILHHLQLYSSYLQNYH